MVESEVVGVDVSLGVDLGVAVAEAVVVSWLPSVETDASTLMEGNSLHDCFATCATIRDAGCARSTVVMTSTSSLVQRRKASMLELLLPMFR